MENVIQGVTHWSGHSTSTSVTWAVCTLAVAGGVLLLIGFLTPAASITLAIGGVGNALSWFPTIIPHVFCGNLSIFFAAIVAAIALLGPGAYSLDAWLFGRRQIIIPQAPKGGVRSGSA